MEEHEKDAEYHSEQLLEHLNKLVCVECADLKDDRERDSVELLIALERWRENRF